MVQKKKARIRTKADAERAIIRFVKDLIAQGDAVGHVDESTARLTESYSVGFRGSEVSVRWRAENDYPIVIAGTDRPNAVCLPNAVCRVVGKKLYEFLKEQRAIQYASWRRSQRREPLRQLKKLATRLTAAE